MTDSEIAEGQSQTSLEVESNEGELDKEPGGTVGVASGAADATKAGREADGCRERDRHGQSPEEPQQGAGNKDKDKDKKKTAVALQFVLHSVLIMVGLGAHGITAVLVVSMAIKAWPRDTDPLLRLLSGSVLLTVMCLNVLVLHIIVRAVAEQQQRIWRDRNTSK